MRVTRTVVLTALVVMSVPVAVGAQTLGEVFRKVTPSVVVIRATGHEVSASGQKQFAETGSGVLISTDGKVMTAAHVVHTMDAITVELGGESVAAKVIASEPAADLSLLQVERVPAAARVAKMANSDTMQVGDAVIIVGAPYGLSYSLSTGIVSHNISKSGGSEGLGFVVTLNTARQLLLEKKSFWSGLEGQFLPDNVADLLNLPANATGYIVKNVAKGSPGEVIGLRGGTRVVVIDGQEWVLGGDIILEMQGIMAKPANMPKFREAMSRLNSGDPFSAKVLRGGRILELTGKAP